jgi:hypothetical protein
VSGTGISVWQKDLPPGPVLHSHALSICPDTTVKSLKNNVSITKHSSQKSEIYIFKQIIVKDGAQEKCSGTLLLTSQTFSSLSCSTIPYLHNTTYELFPLCFRLHVHEKMCTYLKVYFKKVKKNNFYV